MADRSARKPKPARTRGLKKAGPKIVVSIAEAAWEQALPDVEDIVHGAARLALDGVDRAERIEVSIVLSNDAEIRALNRTWRGQDKPTNVLSFPGDTETDVAKAPILLGDVIVAFETATREVDQDRAAASLADHLAHLIVHGVLHLLGYDHEIDSEAEEMEQLETELLAQLGIPNPYQDHERRTS